jgi:hypothetical protein
LALRRLDRRGSRFGDRRRRRQRLVCPAQSTLLIKYRCIDEFVSALYKLDGAASDAVYAALVWKYEHFSIFRIPSFASGDDNQILSVQHAFSILRFFITMQKSPQKIRGDSNPSYTQCSGKIAA